jgi:hypothetical protein
MVRICLGSIFRVMSGDHEAATCMIRVLQAGVMRPFVSGGTLSSRLQ